MALKALRCESQPVDSNDPQALLHELLVAHGLNVVLAALEWPRLDGFRSVRLFLTVSDPDALAG